LFALLPAGSISGAPKVKTLEIIKNAENYERGYYTGTAFYFDGDNLDSCVLIRFIEQTEKGWVYKSGGGITIYSDARKEYQEILDKIYVPTL
jgi:para-aminobenzoate synthetase component 1